ncbi:hypothetical protein ESCO106017_15675 [Escherichia coli]|nr:hypothetical protein ExPECSC060_02368 [Escherichia coli]GCW30735.1 hypothetical protein HmCmsJML080_01414 [Escherichia coli]
MFKKTIDKFFSIMRNNRVIINSLENDIFIY